MNNDSLVAINVTNKIHNKLLNPSAVPILYYWDGIGSLLESIKQDQDFYNYIMKTCLNDNYTNSGLSYFFYDNTQKRYIDDNNYAIQKLYPLSYIESKNEKLVDFVYNTYLIVIFDNLYKKSFNDNYKFTVDQINVDLINIYKQLKDKYKEKLSKETTINFIRLRLDKDYNMTNENIGWVCDRVRKILVDME